MSDGDARLHGSPLGDVGPVPDQSLITEAVRLAAININFKHRDTIVVGTLPAESFFILYYT